MAASRELLTQALIATLPLRDVCDMPPPESSEEWHIQMRAVCKECGGGGVPSLGDETLADYKFERRRERRYIRAQKCVRVAAIMAAIGVVITAGALLMTSMTPVVSTLIVAGLALAAIYPGQHGLRRILAKLKSDHGIAAVYIVKPPPETGRQLDFMRRTGRVPGRRYSGGKDSRGFPLGDLIREEDE